MQKLRVVRDGFEKSRVGYMDDYNNVRRKCLNFIVVSTRTLGAFWRVRTRSRRPRLRARGVSPRARTPTPSPSLSTLAPTPAPLATPARGSHTARSRRTTTSRASSPSTRRATDARSSIDCDSIPISGDDVKRAARVVRALEETRKPFARSTTSARRSLDRLARCGEIARARVRAPSRARRLSAD